MRHPSTVVVLLAACGLASAQPDGAVARGKKALLTRAFNLPEFTFKAYDNVWKVWGLKEKPAEFDRLFRERYGLHPAPYANGKYPMGLREATGLLGKGLTTDCMACHGSSIAGESYVGLGNASGDYQALSQELTEAAGRKPHALMQSTRVRGTSEAFAMSVFLLGLREPDMSIRAEGWIDLGLQDELCEDTPAWWLLRKKQTMYHHGGMDARSVRSLMQFMMTPFNQRADFDREEATFTDIQAYLLGMEAPKYVFPINLVKAAEGKKLFVRNCARCHGTYGEQWTYPNKIVPLEEIGTDAARYHGLSKKATNYYNTTWFAQDKRGGAGHRGTLTKGYQAPPLDGIWATAPYFHNGSVPTVYHVLNSKARPKTFTRSFNTGKADYDPVRLGWKIVVLEKGPDEKLPPIERRKVYDTTQRGRGNEGHIYGDELTDEERFALIEYLKTL